MKNQMEIGENGKFTKRLFLYEKRNKKIKINWKENWKDEEKFNF